MNQKRISERMTLISDDEGRELVITGSVERWKLTLLTTWLLAWIFVGGVVLAEFLASEQRDFKLMLGVFLVLWSYYLWKVGQVWFYRRKGYERIRLSPGTLTISRKGWKLIAQRYFLDNIHSLKEIEMSGKSWATNYENLWWVMGGEKVGFDYTGKLVRFGMQLNAKETAELLRFLQRGIPKYRGRQG